jgi:hypothetical protein
VQVPENVVPPEPFFAELKKRDFRFRSWQMKKSRSISKRK